MSRLGRLDDLGHGLVRKNRESVIKNDRFWRLDFSPLAGLESRTYGAFKFAERTMILHVDMDAFYAAVEQRDRPELAGEAVIVGGTPQGRGVVCAANYEARKFGVHSAMPAVTAKRLCPHAVFLAPRMKHYAEISDQIRAVFDRYTPLVEPLSLDEAFLDVTGSESLFGDSIHIGRQIKCEILEELNLVASVGVAPNKFLAKVASDLEKPDGFVVVDPRHVQQFLDPLPVSRLWGVGRVTDKTFQRLQIRTIQDLRRLPESVLHEQFGEHGRHLWQLARGIDLRQVVPYRQAKSISHETTFAVDIDDEEVLRAWAIELSEQVAWRLRRHQLRGRTVHLKVRFRDFRTISRAQTLVNATDVTEEIRGATIDMLSRRLPHDRLSVRLLGVGVSGFDDGDQRQRLLFEEQEHAAQQRVDAAVDKIRDRFGKSSLGRAASLLRIPKASPSYGEDEKRSS